MTTLAIFPFKQVLHHQTNTLKIMQFDSAGLETQFCSLYTEKLPVNVAFTRNYLLPVSPTLQPYKCTNPGPWNTTTVLQIIVVVFILLSLKFVFFLGVFNHPSFNLLRQSRTLLLLIKYFWWNKIKRLSFQSVLVTGLFCSACET